MLADDVSEILNSVKVKNPDQKSEPLQEGPIETEALQSKEPNSEHESTSVARKRTSKELPNALNAPRRRSHRGFLQGSLICSRPLQ